MAAAVIVIGQAAVGEAVVWQQQKRLPEAEQQVVVAESIEWLETAAVDVVAAAGPWVSRWGSLGAGGARRAPPPCARIGSVQTQEDPTAETITKGKNRRFSGL